MVKALVNKKSFEIEDTHDGFVVNGDLFKWDIRKAGENIFHILYKNQSFNAELVKADRASKTFVVKVNGKPLTVELKDRFDLLLERWA